MLDAGHFPSNSRGRIVGSARMARRDTKADPIVWVAVGCVHRTRGPRPLVAEWSRAQRQLRLARNWSTAFFTATAAARMVSSMRTFRMAVESLFVVGTRAIVPGARSPRNGRAAWIRVSTGAPRHGDRDFRRRNFRSSRISVRWY